MRRRHTERFTDAVREHFGITSIDGIDAGIAADAMTCMVEQVAYVWYGHEAIHHRTVDLERAAEITSLAWYRLFFGHDASPSA